MKKILLALLAFNFIIFVTAFSQSTTCPWVNAGPDQTVCAPNCATLTATFLQVNATTTYTQAVIPYAPDPFNVGTTVTLFDDHQTGFLALPFTFCYYGNAYNQFIIGSNGWLGFTVTTSTWVITNPVPDNSGATPVNCIMGPWHDINPGVGGTVRYQMYGSAPCRRMTVSWQNVPMYSCGTPATQQIIIYETSNIIDNFIQTKPLCAGWNAGRAIQAVHNLTGTAAVVVPGRNSPTQWTANNEGRRYTPAGANATAISWINNTTNAVVGNTATVNVCPTATTTYTAQITYTNCNNTTTQVTDQVIVNVSPPLTITVTPNNPSYCPGGSVNLVASGAGTYVWSPATGLSCTNCANPTANPTATTTYTVVGTNGAGCTGSTTVTVTVLPQPTITVTPSAPSICIGGNVSLNASGANTYVWSPATGLSCTNCANPTANPTATTTYTVVGTGSNGCTNTATVTVTVNPSPTITVTPNNPQICIGGSTNLTASGATTYVWSPATNLSCTNCANPTANPTATTTYTVVGTDVNGCTGTTTVTVTLNPLPTITVTPSAPSICVGGSVNLTASGANTYVWTPATGLSCTNCANPSANPTTTTTYTVTGTSIAGCTNTTTVTVTVNQSAALTTSFTAPLCNGGCNGTATVTATGGNSPYTYLWNPSAQTNATATGLCAGTYTVTVTTANGCTSTATVTVTQPTALTANTSMTPVACNGGTNGTATVVASGGTSPYSYLWNPSAQTNATATGLAAGTYTVTVTDANGCTTTATITITQPTALTTTISATQATCGNPNGTATVVASGGTPGYTYNWSPSGGTNATATGLTANSYTVTVTDANGCTTTATIIVTNAGSPTATISTSTNILCFGGNNGSATVVATGGQAPYTYLWNPSAQTTPTATGLTAGTYTVTVTDANGCSAVATVTITQPTQLTVSATSTAVLCNGGNTGTATATANGGTPAYTYNWTPSGGTNATATGLTAGTYTITVTDANGCTATATVTVTQPTALTANTSMTPVACNGGTNGTVTVVASGGTSPYSYLWNPSAQTNATATGLAAGTYTVTVTDANGCTTTATITITQPTAITLATSSVQAICGNPNGSATVTPSGGTPGYTYLWTPSGQTTPTATGLSANTYTVVVTDANGCTATTTVTVTNAGSPTATISASTNVLCFGGNNGSATVVATGGQAPYTFLWNPSAQTTPTATGLTAGTYTVTVTDANGCSATATVTITEPTQLVVTAGAPTNVLCNGGNTGAASVTASGGTSPYTYLWNPSAQTTANATGLTAGTYTCTVTDANGCTAQATVTVTEPTLLTIAVNTQTNILCFGGNNGDATAAANGGTTPYTYLWNNAQTGATATGLIAGTYTVTTTDANGCTAQATVTITEPTQLVLSSTSNTAHCGQPDGDATVTASGGTPAYTYLWNNGQTTATATGLVPNTYTVTVTDANGCSDTSIVIVPNATGVVATITASDSANCFGSCDGSATVTANGGNAPYSYAWAPSGGNAATANNLCVGTYTVTVTDANGCSDTATVTILEPAQLSLQAINGTIICNGQTVNVTANASGGTPAYNYLWMPGNLTGQTVALSPTTNTTYTVTVTDAYGCTAQSVTFTINVRPPLSVSATANPPAICFNSSTQLTANGTGGNGGPYTYVWMPGNLTGQTVTVGPTTTTTYTVTVTDGCTTLPDTATVTVVVNPLPVPTFTSDVTSGCQPVCVNFTNTTQNSSSCSWNFGDGNTFLGCNPPQHCYPNDGQYSVSLTVTDINGCVGTNTITNMITVFPLPVAQFSFTPNNATVLNGLISFTDLSTNASQWTWSFGDVNNGSSTVQNPQYTYTDSGSYVIILLVVSPDGCIDTVQHTLDIGSDFALYVPNAFTPNGNGNNEMFIPIGTGIDEDNFEMWIYDRWGNMIWYTQTLKGWDGRANGGSEVVQQDVYVWKILTKDFNGNTISRLGHVTVIK